MTAIKSKALGHWQSLAVELRPSAIKNADGSLKPFFLKRYFKLTANDQFELTILNYVDASGQVPLAELCIHGHVSWKGEHPVAAGAQKVDFIADEAYTVKPLLAAFADVLNNSTNGFEQWRVGEAQNIFQKAFPTFGLEEGQVFKEYDLIYIDAGLMFWGARHVDGRGFDSEANRPTNLQIPLKRVE
jgi:hypothetical protein